MTIYQRIQELAKRRKISIRELEKQLGFSNGTLNKWKDSAPSDKLATVAQYLNTSVQYLVIGHVDPDGQMELPIDYRGAKPKRHVEITDPTVAMTFEGKPIPKDDMELIKRLLRGRD